VHFNDVKMQDLKELISVVSRHKIKQIEIVGNENHDVNSKFQQLYDLVQSEQIHSDTEAITILYPDSKNAKEPYAKLKNRLKNRLINTLFFIDINQPQFTDIQQAFFTCNKNWMAARTLLSRGATNSGIKLAENTVRIALKYEFTELIIYLSKQLLWHYSVIIANESKYAYFNKILIRALSDLNAETLAEQYYSEILKIFSKSQATIKEDIRQRVIIYSNNLQSQFANIISFRFIRISYLLHIIRYQINGDFDNAIITCHQAISIIEKKPYNSKGALLGFNLRLLSCYIQVKRYDEAQKLADHYSKSLTSGSYNWYIIQFYYFLSCFHSQDYNLSYVVLHKAITHHKFDNLYANQKQIWFVNQAFLHFLTEIGKIDFSILRKTKNFRLYKFLNDIPIYSKDKRGINISILIVHVLLLLQQRKFLKIIDRVDALNQYCHRYLRRDDTFRANCFIKMLLQMAKADFNRIRTERYAEKYKVKLLTVPLNVADHGIEVEIIPYEHLWEMVLELLD
jgi:hypothetical protein